MDHDGVEGMLSIQGLAKAGTEVGGRIRIKSGTVRRTDIGEFCHAVQKGAFNRQESGRGDKNWELM